MRKLDELMNTPNLLVCRTAQDGGRGEIYFHKWTGSVIWSYGGGWEHVSVSPFKKHITPSWDDMCKIKDMFFEEEETVVQYHPSKSEYVNNMPNCLHLWRPLVDVMPTPPSIMVGIKGVTYEA